MRILLVTLLLLAGLAGCLDDDADPTDDAAIASEDSGVQAVTPGINVSIDTNGTVATSEVIFEVAEMTYADSLRRFAIVAGQDLEVAYTLQGSLGAYDQDENCLAMGVHVPYVVPGADEVGAGGQNNTGDQNGTAAGNQTGEGLAPDGTGGPDLSHYRANVVAWAWKNEIEAQATVAGITVGESNGGGNRAAVTGYEAQDRQTFTVPAGQEILVELGGREPSWIQEGSFQDSATAVPNQWRLDWNITGEATVEDRGEVPLRCGVGVRQVESDAMVATTAGQASTGGTVELETVQGSTLLVEHQRMAETPQSVEAVFLDESVMDPEVLHRTSAETGRVALEFGAWTEAYLADIHWFMADVHWPAMGV